MIAKLGTIPAWRWSSRATGLRDERGASRFEHVRERILEASHVFQHAW